MHMFMHLIEPSMDIFDDEGIDFPNIDGAHHAAIECARDIIAWDIKEGQPLNLNRRIDIADGTGAILLSVPFTEALKIQG